VLWTGKGEFYTGMRVKIKTKNIIVIEILGNYIKILVGINNFSNFQITNIFVKNIGGLSDNSISDIIKEYIDRLNLKNKIVLVVLPSSLSITKNIEVPSIDPYEIKEIVNLQAYRHTPFSKEEVIVDYIDLGTYKNSYTKILLIIVNKQVVKRYFSILEKAYIDLENVFFAPEVVAFSLFKLFNIEDKNFPVILVNIDEITTDFFIILKEKIIFNRNIPIGSINLLLDKEKNILTMTEEIKRSLEAYQLEDIDKIPQLLFLTGASEAVNYVYNTLETTIHIPTKKILNFENISIAKEVEDTIYSNKKISFLNLISSLFAFGKNKINLIPEEIKLKKIFEERSKELIKTGIYLTISFVLFFCILLLKIYFNTLYLKNIKNEHQKLSSEAEKLQKDYEKIVFVRNYISNRGVPLEILIELYNIIPSEVELSEIRLDEKKRLSLKGSADSMSVVFLFAERLNKSKFFKDTKTRYTSKRKDVAGEVTDFEIVCFINDKHKI